MTFDPMEKAKDLADQISSTGKLYRIAWKSSRSKNPHHLRFGDERIGGRGTLGYMRDGVLTTSNGHTGTYRRLKEFAGIFHDQHEVEIRINCAVKERRPVGASDDPRPRMEKACERLSEPPEPERARAFWCLPPAPFFGFLYRSFSDYEI